ncbi:MAG: hypothetical protein H0V09_12095, partial [Gemmatimonadetes bacterium]|nr:hypothetical protein [Gemmatimonadota bacterium]
MTAVPRLRGTLVLLLGLATAACSTLSTLGSLGAEPEADPPRSASSAASFLARQYLQRGRAAWAAGNMANARFLIGRAIELDPASEAGLSAWRTYWPADSLPPAALAARR